MQFTKLSCEEFIAVLASKEPVPGGGGAAALAGAVGVALGGMVASLTIGKKKYLDVQDDIIALKAKSDALQRGLIELVGRDAEVFGPLSKAYGMPKETEEERAEKSRVMSKALTECCEVPLEIMRLCMEAIDLHKEFASKGSAIAVSDAGCGVILCKAAMQAASLNVFINTKIMEDRGLAEGYNKEANDILAAGLAKADAVFAGVAAKLTG